MQTPPTAHGRRRNRQSALLPGEPIISLAGVTKTYGSGNAAYEALRGIDLCIMPGEMVSIVGPSASGKTTLINLISSIDRPTSGVVTVNGSRLETKTEEQLARWRGRNIGLIFQSFQLLPTLSALENAELPLDLAKLGSLRNRRKVARRHLALVGLDSRARRLPSQLSGGEQQRVAIARAMACNPKILLGDEPTGNLDSENALSMFNLLKAQHELGTTVVYVTHDPALAALAPRTITVRDGSLVSDTGTTR